MVERRHWGKAGVPLDGKQLQRRRSATVRDTISVAEDNAIAKQRWAAGMVVPYNITTALDAMSLHGPEVDAACGVREPAVDMWEAGKLYPTWHQLVALAELTHCTPRFFTVAFRGLSPFDTTLRFHAKLAPCEQSVMRYPDDVVRRCSGTGGTAPDPQAGA